MKNIFIVFLTAVTCFMSCETDDAAIGPIFFHLVKSEGYLETVTDLNMSADYLDHQNFKEGNPGKMNFRIFAEAGISAFYLDVYSDDEHKFETKISRFYEDFSREDTVSYEFVAQENKSIYRIHIVDGNHQHRIFNAIMNVYAEEALLKLYGSFRLYNSSASGQDFAFDLINLKGIADQNITSIPRDLESLQQSGVDFIQSIGSRSGTLFKEHSHTGLTLKPQLKDSYESLTQSATSTLQNVEPGKGYYLKLRGQDNYAYLIITNVVNDGLDSQHGGSDLDYIEFILIK